ncbi:MAG: AEC family transporter [Candidatus Omnitrophica bacterium]|nr:AEC family transporter [Candidatus Omnitrophota bacterium]
MEFLLTFYTVFTAMLQIFTIALCGFLFFRWKLLDKTAISGLSNLIINLFLPAMIFSHLIKKFSFTDPKDWWLYPFLGMIICLIGFIAAKVFLQFDKSIVQKNELASIVSFQNCGYLPLILVMSIFSEKQTSVLFTYIFLFIQGYNLIFWSLGIQFLNSEKKIKFEFKKILNPPFLALIFAGLILCLNLKIYIPKLFLQATDLVGGCTLPVALIVLGAILAACDGGKVYKLNSGLLLKTVILKLVVVPAIVLFIVVFLKLPKYMSILLLIEAAMPAAINLSVVSFKQSESCGYITQAVFLTHVCGIITVPLFVTIMSFFIPL